MGLASKLATIQAAQGAYNQYTGGASQYGAAPGQGAAGGYGSTAGQYNRPPGAPPQSSYGSAAPGGAYGAPQTHQSSYPGQQQSGYGAATTAAGAAAYGASQAYGGQQQHQQYGGPSGYGATAAPGQGQYGQQPQGYGQPQPYGHQPPYGQQQGQQYGAPGSLPYPGAAGAPGQYGGGAHGGNEQQILTELLDNCVRDQKIQAFYPPGSTAQIAARVVQTGALNRLASEWRLPKEVAYDCVKLALFDTILYLDDSGSMRFEEGGSRIDDAKLIVGRVAFAASLFDDDGIAVRFMNSPEQGNNIKSEQQAAALIQRVQFSGLTPLGTALRDRIINPLVLQPARSGQLRKPLLIITVTDGAPAGEARWEVVNTVKNAVNELRNTRYGPDTLSFQFAQVGNDMAARTFLQELDANPEIGSLIDCTSNYELEADEARKTSGVDLSPELWMVKLCLGPIDSGYDSKDEAKRY